MKNLVVCFGLVLSMGACSGSVTAAESEASNPQEDNLEIHVEGLRGTEGNLVLAVYRDKDAFNQRGEPQAWVSAPAQSKTITLKDFPPGQVAISAFHDANGNGEYDMRDDVPLEGWGSSGEFSPWFEPTFEAALTEVGVVTVHMHYYN